MATLDEYLLTSDRAQSDAVRRKREVFEVAHSVAVQITQLREKHQFTQQELAEKTGIAQADISRIERGSVNPRCSTLARLAEALGAELRLVEVVDT